MSDWLVRHVRNDEFEAWSRLFRGYAAFYNRPTSDDHQRQIWGWIHADRTIEALVAAPVGSDGDETGEIQGLAHLRQWVRPLLGVQCGYLDDLFVDPNHRGSGAVDALFAAMRQLARRARLVDHPVDHSRRQLPGASRLRRGGHAHDVDHL